MTAPVVAEVRVACGNPSKAARLCNRGRLVFASREKLSAEPLPQEGVVVLRGALREVRDAVRALRSYELTGRKGEQDALFHLDFWYEPHKNLPLDVRLSAEQNRELRSLAALVRGYADRTPGAPDCVPMLADAVSRMLQSGRFVG